MAELLVHIGLVGEHLDELDLHIAEMTQRATLERMPEAAPR